MTDISNSASAPCFIAQPAIQEPTPPVAVKATPSAYWERLRFRVEANPWLNLFVGRAPLPARFLVWAQRNVD